VAASGRRTESRLPGPDGVNTGRALFTNTASLWLQTWPSVLVQAMTMELNAGFPLMSMMSTDPLAESQPVIVPRKFDTVRTTTEILDARG
jgi:hypothetical protein